MSETALAMEKAVACLALELPAEVWEDVRDIWHAARDAAKALDESRMWAIDENLRAAGEEIAKLRDALEEIARIDFRGYPHESARIARKALIHA